MEAAASVRAAKSTAVILRSFCNMTRLPRFLFGGEPQLDWLSANSHRKQGTSWETGGCPYTRWRLSRDMVNSLPPERGSLSRREQVEGIAPSSPRLPIRLLPSGHPLESPN